MTNNRLVIPTRSSEDNPHVGYIYLISEPHGYYKIGQAGDVDIRFRTLQQATPFELVVVDAIKVDDRDRAERFIHGALAKYHHRNEWFKLPSKAVWDNAVTLFTLHLIEESQPKPVPVPTYDNYSEEIRAKLVKLPV